MALAFRNIRATNVEFIKTEHRNFIVRKCDEFFCLPPTSLSALQKYDRHER